MWGAFYLFEQSPQLRWGPWGGRTGEGGEAASLPEALRASWGFLAGISGGFL
jgi:hypothetical protein